MRNRLRPRTPIETKISFVKLTYRAILKYVFFSRISDTVAISLEKDALLQVQGLVKTNN